MIERLSTNPIIKTTFLLVDYSDHECVVTFGFQIGVNGTNLSSQPLPAQVQRDGKFSRAPGGRELWNEEMVARLSAALGRRNAALETSKLDIHALAASGIKWHLRQAAVVNAQTQLESTEKEMVTRDFFSYFSRFLIPLNCPDSGDDRYYAFYRGTVWSCERQLEEAQWSLLADRFIEQQPIEVKRFSRKATVECKRTVSDRGVEITFEVKALAASFVSSEAIKREASDDWVTEQGKLRTALQAYNTVLTEVAARYTQSRQVFPSASLEQLTNLPTQGTVGSDTIRPTPDEWRDVHLAHINKRLDEWDHCNNAVVRTSIVEFHKRLRQDIDERRVLLLTCIAQTQLEIQERHQRLCREAVSEDEVLQVKGEPVKLTREDKGSELEYTLYRGVVWECGRPLLPEQWRALADSCLAEEETMLAKELNPAPDEQALSIASKERRQGIPTPVRRAVWARDNGQCATCGSRERLEYDHIIPVSKGGSNTERNIELLCEECNRAKSDAIM